MDSKALERHLIGGSLDDFPPAAPGFGRIERAAQAEMEEILLKDILRRHGIEVDDDSA